MNVETEVYIGSSVKALGDGRVGGYLVRFGSSKETDLDGDFFTKDTNFGIATPAKSALYYSHGLDAVLGVKSLGEASITKIDDIGVWAEAQLDLSDAYQAVIYSLTQQGRMGWSSGTVKHLIRFEEMGSAHKITNWPLGLDASLTPIPAEPKCLVMPLKSFSEMLPKVGIGVTDKSDRTPSDKKGVFLGEYIGEQVTYDAVYSANCALLWAIFDAIYDEEVDGARLGEIITGACDEFRDIILQFVQLVESTDDEESMKMLRDFYPDPSLKNFKPEGLMKDTKHAADAVLSCAKRWSDRAVLRQETKGMKSGAVLSKSNAGTIKDAHAAIGDAMSTLGDAKSSLAGLMEMAGVEYNALDEETQMKMLAAFEHERFQHLMRSRV